MVSLRCFFFPSKQHADFVTYAVPASALGIMSDESIRGSSEGSAELVVCWATRTESSRLISLDGSGKSGRHLLSRLPSVPMLARLVPVWLLFLRAESRRAFEREERQRQGKVTFAEEEGRARQKSIEAGTSHLRGSQPPCLATFTTITHRRLSPPSMPFRLPAALTTSLPRTALANTCKSNASRLPSALASVRAITPRSFASSSRTMSIPVPTDYVSGFRQAVREELCNEGMR